jgi:hypothetical protein
MAQVICIPGPFVTSPQKGDSIVVSTVGRYFVDSSIPIPSIPGNEQVDWATALIEAVAYADRHGIRTVYHMSR